MSIIWQIKTLGEITQTTSGGTPDRKHPEYYGGTIPWVRSGELDKGIIKDTEITLTEKGLENSSAKIFPVGTLLIALYGASIGKLAFLGVPAATNQAICAIFANQTVSLKFLFYYLLHKRPDLIKQGIGGAQSNISQSILKNLIVSYPVDIKEQERIVARIEEMFSQLDSAVATLQNTKQQLALYRQAVLKEAFQGCFTRHFSIRVSLPWLEINDNSYLPQIPSEWRYVALKALGDLGRGKSKHRPRNDPKLFSDGKHPFIQTGEVRAAKEYITEYDRLYGEFGLQQSKLWQKEHYVLL